MQVHVIHEIDCSVERIDPAVVEAFLDTELSDDPMLADSICAMADAMSAELHPRGVYKLFNPAICTLPPKYTEPAIKLVGTLAVLYGSAAYERMSEAEHTAMAVSTIGTDEEIACLRERLVKSDMDALLFDACLEAMASLAADKLAEAVADDAHERGLHRGSTLETGVEDFPRSPSSPRPRSAWGSPPPRTARRRIAGAPGASSACTTRPRRSAAAAPTATTCAPAPSARSA